jgi:hypothetical protein
MIKQPSLGRIYDYLKFASDAILRLNGEEISFRNIDVHYSYRDGECEIDQNYSSTFNTFMTTLCLYLADRQGMGMRWKFVHL